MVQFSGAGSGAPTFVVMQRLGHPANLVVPTLSQETRKDGAPSPRPVYNLFRKRTVPSFFVSPEGALHGMFPGSATTKLKNLYTSRLSRVSSIVISARVSNTDFLWSASEE
jgi:hypothetical protein